MTIQYPISTGSIWGEGSRQKVRQYNTTCLLNTITLEMDASKNYCSITVINNIGHNHGLLVVDESAWLTTHPPPYTDLLDLLAYLVVHKIRDFSLTNIIYLWIIKYISSTSFKRCNSFECVIVLELHSVTWTVLPLKCSPGFSNSWM